MSRLNARSPKQIEIIACYTLRNLSLKSLSQPIGKSDAQGDYRKGRVGVPARRKHRAAANEKICHTVHLAIPIYYSAAWRIMHSGSSDVMVLIRHVIGPFRRLFQYPGLEGDFSDTGLAKFFAQCLCELPDRVKRQVG